MGISIRIAVLLGLLVGLCSAGCGLYSFSGAVPGGVETVAVPLFDNQTAEYGIREQITDALISRFVQDNIVKVVDIGRAEAILRGTIVRISDEPYAIQQSETVDEYRIIVTIRVILEDAGTGDAIWTQDFSEWGNYPGGSLERDTGIAVAITKLTEDISNKVVSGW